MAITRDDLIRNDRTPATGGRYTVNGNTHQVAFRGIRRVYNLKNCSEAQVMEAMDGLIGGHTTEEEYDAACVALLQSKGWI